MNTGPSCGDQYNVESHVAPDKSRLSTSGAGVCVCGGGGGVLTMYYSLRNCKDVFLETNKQPE